RFPAPRRRPRGGSLLGGAAFAGEAGAPPPASAAFAVRLADDVAQVVAAVTVSDLFVRPDPPQRLDIDAAAEHHRLGVRIAGVVGVARHIRTRRAVDGDVLGHFEEITVAARFGAQGRRFRHARTPVFDDAGALPDFAGGE